MGDTMFKMGNPLEVLAGIFLAILIQLILELPLSPWAIIGHHRPPPATAYHPFAG
jgi:hypothetical protein